MHYISLAAEQRYPKAQYFLGHVLINSKKFDRAIYYFKNSAQNGLIEGKFTYAFLLHDGKYIEQDIFKAISLYKDASSFNDQYSKNNLGIIYKNGFGNKIKKTISNAIVYFEEAIHQSNDIVSMYNLSHLYIYDRPIKNSIDESIKLLIKSYSRGFSLQNIFYF